MDEKNDNKTKEQELAIHHVYDWIWELGSMPGIIPPFCIEVMLSDGSNYYLHSIPERNEHTLSMVMRVWDFRSFTADDIDDLKQNLNGAHTRADLGDFEKIHPKLDWADVRLPLSNINYAIEWNDRVWPREDRPILGLIPRFQQSAPKS